jgi:hypothetical protein
MCYIYKIEKENPIIIFKFALPILLINYVLKETKQLFESRRKVVKSHIISKLQLKNYLGSFLNSNGKFVIEKYILDTDSNSKTWTTEIKSVDDIKSFLGRNYYISIDNPTIKKLETYWSNFEKRFGDFSNLVKKMVQDYVKSEYDDQIKIKINQLIDKHYELIVLYSLICVQREYIRRDQNRGTDVEILLFKISEYINDNTLEDNSKNFYKIKLRDLYHDLMDNFEIRLIDVFHGGIIYDPSFIMTVDYLLNMYQTFGNILFLRKGSKSLQRLDEILSNKNNYLIITHTSQSEQIYFQSVMYEFIRDEFERFEFGKKIIYKLMLQR